MKLKKLALIIATIFTLTACSGNAPTLIDFIDEYEDSLDFDGMVFRVLSYSDSREGLESIANGETPSIRKELFIKRVSEIEQKYNCVIETYGDADNTYSTYYVSGISRADLLQCRIRYSYDMYLNNFFLPVNEIPNVDISSGKYGTKDFIEAFTWNKDLIGLWPVNWGYIFMCFSDGMFFNPSIFTELNIANPNELYEQDNWTWDSLREISNACKQLTTEEYPRYLTAMNNYFPRILIRSNGGEFIQKTENGKYKYALNDLKTVEALQFANELLKDGAINPDGSNWSVITENFGKGNYAIVCEYSQFYDTYINNMDMGVGVCYPPRGPRMEEYITTGLTSFETRLWHVTREKSEEADLLGQFLEIFLEPIDGSSENWKEEYIDMNFLDRTSGEVFLSKIINVEFDKLSFGDPNGVLINIVEECAKRGNITERLQGYESVVNSNLDESVNKYIEN